MSVKGCLKGKKTEHRLQSNWTTPKFTFMTTVPTNKITANFTNLDRWLGVFTEPKVGKNTWFLFCCFLILDI